MDTENLDLGSSDQNAPAAPANSSSVGISSKIKNLLEWAKTVNIASDIDENRLDNIGARVVQEYGIDKNSRSEWEKTISEAMKVAKQLSEEKTFPWPGAANVKIPIITTGALQFAVRAYPEIVKGSEVVKCKIVGDDPNNEKEDKAKRISQHMSWQCLDEMKEWEEETDKLLHMLPVVGIVFRKTYFDSSLQRNVSVLVSAENLVIHYKSKSLDVTRRITEEFNEYANEIHEYMERGIWLKADLGLAQSPDNDEDAPHEFLEQHRWLDLDEDGYQEPYIVTVHKSTNKVMRIVARYDEETIHTISGKMVKIEAIQYYTKYGFIPAPDGSFYDIGFGSLLNALNESCNTIINQLLDAGALQNQGGGFLGRGVKLGKKQAGSYQIRMNEWIRVESTGQELKSNIVPHVFSGPSTVLFQLLGMLIEFSKEISQIKDVLTGQQTSANQSPTTTLALIEQGQKVYNAIYKRIYRSMGEEFKKLFALNGKFLNPEVVFRVLDIPQKVFQNDYRDKSLDVIPVADPNLSSDVQRLAKAQAAMALMGKPGINDAGLVEMYIDAIQLPDKAKIFKMPDPNQPIPDPKMIEVQGKIQAAMAQVQIKQQEFQLKEAEFQMKAQTFQLQIEQMQAQIDNLKSAAILNVSQADATSGELELEKLRVFVDSLDEETKRQHEARLEAVQLGHDATLAHIANLHDLNITRVQQGHEADQAELDRQHEADQAELDRQQTPEVSDNVSTTGTDEQG